MRVLRVFFTQHRGRAGRAGVGKRARENENRVKKTRKTRITPQSTCWVSPLQFGRRHPKPQQIRQKHAADIAAAIRARRRQCSPYPRPARAPMNDWPGDTAAKNRRKTAPETVQRPPLGSRCRNAPPSRRSSG
jgi:hypothetical protein